MNIVRLRKPDMVYDNGEKRISALLDGVKLTIVRLPPNSIGKMHTHKTLTEMILVMRGSIIAYELGDDPKGAPSRVDRGCAVLFRPGIFHRTSNESDDVAMAIAIKFRSKATNVDEFKKLIETDWTPISKNRV